MLDKANGRSLRSGFLYQVNQRSNAPALVVRGVTKTYGELDHTARMWASALQSVAAGVPERIGLLAHRSEISYTSALAALYSGAAFVPLNPTFPPEKIASMIDQADLQAIVVDKTGAGLLSEIGRHMTTQLPPLLLPEFEAPQLQGSVTTVLGKDKIAGFPQLQDLPPLIPEDIAYLLFTSGSTGKPKGVPVNHGNAVHFMDVMTERYGITPADRFSQTFDQSFDLSVFDLFLSWSNGACVYSMSSIELLAPGKFINNNGLTVWFCVPSLPAHMIRRNTLTPGSMPGLRLSLFCGEPLPKRTAEMWQAAAPESILENLYGPTELTIACFHYRWNSISSPAECYNDLVPIGTAYAGLSSLVVGDDLSPVAPGQAGELCVSGPQTTPGYWREPAKTAEKFIDIPLSEFESRRFYRTGDLVIRSASGDHLFLGRADYQIKVLGHRVELGEIEAVLRREEGIEHAVAAGWPLVNGSADRIVAFVSGEEVNTAKLMEEAKRALPPYAVPQEIIHVERMPLNSNGKIDRRALSEGLAEKVASSGVMR